MCETASRSTPYLLALSFLMLSAQLATPGAWVDTDQICSAAVLAAVRAAGKQGVGRYGPLPRNSSAGDLSGPELTRICEGNLQCLLFQHVRRPEQGYTGWRPSQHSGIEDAVAIIDHAKSIDYALGDHICLDFENIDDSPYAATKFAVDWQAAVISAGYRAMLYVGFQVPLHSIDLYNLPGFDSYASDIGDRHVATRGTSYVQRKYDVVIGGVKFDAADMRIDLLGAIPYVATLMAAA